MHYYTKFTPEKKLSKTVTRLATVQVFNEKYKLIGTETVSKWQSYQTVSQQVYNDYNISKIWNKIRK